MKLISAVIQPPKLEEVRLLLERAGVGARATTIRGAAVATVAIL